MNLSLSKLSPYFKTNTPLGYIYFFNCITKNLYKICILNIFNPQAVDPAQPPINISIKKILMENHPNRYNLLVTYPVPVSIETTLNITCRNNNKLTQND